MSVKESPIGRTITSCVHHPSLSVTDGDSETYPLAGETHSEGGDIYSCYDE